MLGVCEIRDVPQVYTYASCELTHFMRRRPKTYDPLLPKLSEVWDHTAIIANCLDLPLADSEASFNNGHQFVTILQVHCSYIYNTVSWRAGTHARLAVVN